jgi:DNA-binding MarR family transcriptional regulator
MPSDGVLQAIRQSKPFACLEQAVHVNLLLTAEVLARSVAELLKPHGLTPAQYNILRILRGAPREGLPCGEIGGRLITRVPDITRLIDRLEGRGLVQRAHDPADRRVTLVHITPEGLRVLRPIDQPMVDLHQRMLKPLGEKRLKQLDMLLDLARGEGR